MNSQESHGLACLEVWGGNQRVAQEVALPGLAGWICSEPLTGSSAGGDLYYLSACSQGQMARVSLADVSGHGESVSRVAEHLRELMRKHINAFDQSDFMRELNESFRQPWMTGVKYATVAALGFYRPTGQLVFTNAGHLPALWYRAAQKQWVFLEGSSSHLAADVSDLPLGLIPGTDYLQTAIRFAPGDLLILYTDALSEAQNPAGEELGRDGLLRLAGSIPTHSPTAAGQALLEAAARFRAGSPVTDDQTVLVLQNVPT